MSGTRYFHYSDDAEARQKELEIVNSLAEDGLFLDPSFPATGASLYYDPLRPPSGYLPPSCLSYERINQLEIRGCLLPQTFPSSEMRAGVVQGALDDCYFLNALEAATEECLKDKIVSDEYRGRGIYTVKFFKGGKWCYVHVSDQIPCNLAGAVYFSRSSDVNVSYVMVLEKAYAKLHGTYESVRGGNVEYAISDVTGCGTAAVRLTEAKFARMVESGGMWQKFKKEFDEGQKHCFSRTRASNSRAHEQGMLGGHAYPVIDVCELHADATADLEARDVKLVRIADRWAIGDGWKGEWSREDVAWEDYPDIRKICDRKPAVTNTTWMKWEDVIANFTTIFTTYEISSPATTVSYSGAWSVGDVKSGAGGMPGEESFAQNPQYAFAVSEPTTVIAVLEQTDLMFSKGLTYDRTYKASIGFVVMKLTGTKSRSTKYHATKMVGTSTTFGKARSVAGTTTLMPGRYVIVPCTTKADVEGSFALRVASDKGITLENNGDDMADADDEESDDEELGESVVPAGALEENEDSGFEEDDESRGLQSLMLMVGDLALYTKGLGEEITQLQGLCKVVEGKVAQLA